MQDKADSIVEAYKRLIHLCFPLPSLNEKERETITSEFNVKLKQPVRELRVSVLKMFLLSTKPRVQRWEIDGLIRQLQTDVCCSLYDRIPYPTMDQINALVDARELVFPVDILKQTPPNKEFIQFYKWMEKQSLQLFDTHVDAIKRLLDQYREKLTVQYPVDDRPWYEKRYDEFRNKLINLIVANRNPKPENFLAEFMGDPDLASFVSTLDQRTQMEDGRPLSDVFINNFGEDILKEIIKACVPLRVHMMIYSKIY